MKARICGFVIWTVVLVPVSAKTKRKKKKEATYFLCLNMFSILGTEIKKMRNKVGAQETMRREIEIQVYWE